MRGNKIENSDKVAVKNLRKLIEKQAKEIAELHHDICVKRSEINENLKVIESHTIRRVRMYNSLMIEKTDLIGRMMRIDQRIMALGFELKQPDGLTCNYEVTRK